MSAKWRIAVLALLGATSITGSSLAVADLVLIAGASGRTGSAVARRLSSSGLALRPLTSDRARAIRKHGDHWPWRQVDVRDAHAVRQAMIGVDYVICTLGAREREGPSGPEFVDYGGVRNLVDAAKSVGIKRFVLMSSAAAGPDRERSQMTQYGDVRYWKTRGEDHLKASGLAYTIVAASGLEDKPSAGDGLRILARRDYETGLVPIEDVAMLLVDALGNPDMLNKTFAVVRDPNAARQGWRRMIKALPPDAGTTDSSATTPQPR
jgi:uncharacterized protein YbjT (DUF2867 family)